MNQTIGGMSIGGNVVELDHGDDHISPEEGRQWHDDGGLINTINTIKLEE